MTVTTMGTVPNFVDEPVTDGVRIVNFFNGRLLAAEDLRREQDANRTLRDRLGTAVGDGIVSGLWVSLPAGGDPAQPVLAVSAGTAVNRAGVALQLAADTTVSLAQRGTVATPLAGRDFAACSGLADDAPFTNSGVYLLTIAPASAPVGRAPVSGLGNETAACNTDASAEGVEFHVLHLALDPALLAGTAHLRNQVAHLMFGTGDPGADRLERDPFGTRAGPYGMLDKLRQSCLSDDEVPLACVLWTAGVGIRYVDLWSVRRRIVRPSPDPDWPEATGDMRIAVGEARFLQFQDQAGELLAAVPSGRIVADDYFQYLPPAGLLPLGSPVVSGYDYSFFFQNLPFRGPVIIEPAHLEAVIQQSFGYPAIDVTRREALWLYEVRDNLQPPPVATPAPQAYVVFSSGHLPYRGDARFNLAYWNYANYARVG
jgi:hypothetical protein